MGCVQTGEEFCVHRKRKLMCASEQNVVNVRFLFVLLLFACFLSLFFATTIVDLAVLSGFRGKMDQNEFGAYSIKGGMHSP